MTVDVTSSRGCKGETHVLVQLNDRSKLTLQPQLEEMCVLLCCVAVLLGYGSEKCPHVLHEGKESKQLWHSYLLVYYKEETPT